MTVLAKTCPCCGQKIEALPAPGLLELVSPAQRRLLERLVQAYPVGLHHERMINWLWGDDLDGGPDDPIGTIGVMMCHIRKIIEPYGWTVRSDRSRGLLLERV